MANWKLPAVEPVLDFICQPQHYEYIYEVPKCIETEKFIMSNCCHNEHVGLRNRYLKQMQHGLSYDRDIVRNIVYKLSLEFKKHFTGRQQVSDFFNDHSGTMKQRYFQAIEKVNESNFRLYKHNKCSAFVKNELYDEIKPPRMIINRDPRFNLLYSCFTIPLEHAMMKIEQFSKGKNYIQRGEQFADLVYGAWILEGDCSKFEASQRLQLLVDVELQLWRYLLNDLDYRDVEKLFWAKMCKCGYTANGCKFSFYSMRGSGDMDTGLFNSILMYVACRYFEIKNNTYHGNFIVDGDDNLLKIPIGMDNYVNTFADFGFDAKLKVRKDYHDAEYCSGKFLQINRAGDFMYFQNIKKIMNNMAIFRKSKFKHCKDTYYHSLGYMYNQIYGQIPLYSDYAKYLMRNSKTKISMKLLREINPIYPDLITHGKNTLKFDDSILPEIMISFDLTIGEIDIIKAFCKQSLPLRPDERRRYRPDKGTTQLDLVKIQQVSDYMFNELRRT
jgi:hypothetical protein